MAGNFVWYDMMTYDKEGSLDFYCDVVGYTRKPFGDTGYTMLGVGESAMGGVEALPEEMKGQVPPHWLGYISTSDLSETVPKIEAAGGTIMQQMEVPSVGKIAIFADPQGAVAAAYQSEEDPGIDPPFEQTAGKVSWHDLATSDVEGAKVFYEAAFGWKVMSVMESPTGPYHMWGDETRTWGGVYERPEHMPVSAWMYYIHVPKLSDAIEKTKAGGGALIMHTKIPGDEVIAVVTDHQGAAIAFHATEM